MASPTQKTGRFEFAVAFIALVIFADVGCAGNAGSVGLDAGLIAMYETYPVVSFRVNRCSWMMLLMQVPQRSRLEI